MLDRRGDVKDYELDEIHIAKGIKPAGRHLKSSESYRDISRRGKIKRICSSTLAPVRYPEGFAVLAYQFPAKVNSRRTTLSSGIFQCSGAVTTEELLFDCKLRELFLGDKHND